MNHPETMLRLVRDRQEALAKEAQLDRLAREAKSTAVQEKRERFSVRDLRWILFRPSGA
jgi:predicted GIY-YIG superfamily endonuclease